MHHLHFSMYTSHFDKNCVLMCGRYMNRLSCTPLRVNSSLFFDISYFASTRLIEKIGPFHWKPLFQRCYQRLGAHGPSNRRHMFGSYNYGARFIEVKLKKSITQVRLMWIFSRLMSPNMYIMGRVLNMYCKYKRNFMGKKWQSPTKHLVHINIQHSVLVEISKPLNLLKFNWNHIPLYTAKIILW